MIHNNAFDKTSESIKEFVNVDGYINNKLPEYDVWKVLNGLLNVEVIDVELGITEIPPQSLNKSKIILINLTNFTIKTPNHIRIKKLAFNYMDNLRNLNIKSKIDKIENEAFAFKNLSEKLIISFFEEINGDSFDTNSFIGVQRPVQINFESGLNYLPELPFKTTLNNKNNLIKINRINCFECKNYWIIKIGEQIQEANCTENEKITLFSPHMESWFLSNCKEGKNNLLNISLIIGGCILFALILLISSVIYIKKKRKRAENLDTIHRVGKSNFYDGIENEYQKGKIQDEEMIEILKSANLLISKEKIEILFEVGRGCFGCVNKGILRNSPDQNITVAIKTINKGI